jgi:RimJ/RimL family protein N-acetyltransferase
MNAHESHPSDVSRADVTHAPEKVVTCPLCEPLITLSPTRTLRLRHIQPADEQNLRDLYDRLSPSDLQRRFFTGGMPHEDFLHRWASASGMDSLVLVAELTEADEVQLVGEAGYTTLECGDAELGITVDPAHRGRLGSWLLDSLLRHANEYGIANMQAIVMTDNRPMLALARKRGYAVLGHPDWGIIRLAMSTSGHQPSWPLRSDKPRVLVETNRSRWVGEETLRQAGFDVTICLGAKGASPQCPVLEGLVCPLVEGADAVIVDFVDDSGTAVALTDAERVVHPDARVIVSGIENNRPCDRYKSEEILALLDDLAVIPSEIEQTKD